VLHDLATVVLDVAAMERDDHWPAATAHRVRVTVATETSRLRDLLGLRS